MARYSGKFLGPLWPKPDRREHPFKFALWVLGVPVAQLLCFAVVVALTIPFMLLAWAVMLAFKPIDALINFFKGRS